MTTIVLLLLGIGFALLAISGWRHRSAADPASSVEGFAKVLAAIDPAAQRAPGPGAEADADEPIETIHLDEQVSDLR